MESIPAKESGILAYFMKVLYYHQHFSTPQGSTGNRSYAMARRLLQAGHEVTMVCGSYAGGQTGLTGSYRDGRREGLVDAIRVIELELPYSNRDGFLKRTLTFLRFAWQSTWIALRRDYDVLFATTTPLTAGIPGICARWLRGKPFVFEVRDLWPELPRAMGVITNPVVLWAMGVLEWVSYRSAHRLVGLSPGIVDGIARRGVPRERIALIPNGCDLDLFAVPTEPWRPAGVGPGDLMAVFTGTHGIANGLDAVLDAAAELMRRGRADIKLVLIGDGKLKARLQARATAEGLANVVFHPPVGKLKLAGLMAETDVGMQILANVPAFYYGTSPNKFFDYLASGLPVLNNYPGWLAELITRHRCGFAVPPDDPVSFAEALIQAAGQRELLLGMGERARELARVEYDRGRLAGQFVACLEGAVMGKTTGEDGYRRVAQLHAENIDQGFLSTLGPRFLSLLYRAIDESPDSVLIVTREGVQVVGFVAGTLDMGQVYRRLLRHWLSLGLSLAPSLLIPTRLWRIIEILQHTRGEGGHTQGMTLPAAELLSIAVDPSFRGRGHAERLYAELSAYFAERGLAEFKIVVGAALAPAHRFYRRMGAVPVAEIEVHQGVASTVYVQEM